MKFSSLLAVSLLLRAVNANESTGEDVGNNELFDIVHVVNEVKNLLDKGTRSFKITWDDSLSLYATERSRECPSKDSLTTGELLIRHGDAVNLLQNLKSSEFSSLDPFPTVATIHNKSARIVLDMGSRIGCAPLNCSLGYDYFCVSDTRKHALTRLEKYDCVVDEMYSNLCEELPINYWDMEKEEFKWSMMRWNDQRRAVANKFNYEGMYELSWSEDAAKYAEVLGFSCDPAHAGFLGTHYHMHPRTLDPLGSLWVFTHDTIDGSFLHGNTTIEMFVPERKVFGCVPLDPACCERYSYICVLGPDWSSPNPPNFSTGKVCGDCPDNCEDGLCQTLKANENLATEDNQNLTIVTSTSMDFTWEDTGKAIALLVCFIGATGISLLLVYTLVNTDYHI
ncbi:hypothetical protein GCK72_018681 [Caenorhabditis remanei]|uniref:SCP domain-containing protein n=1 Tax=Caenorhabditis remanei TaxID=31234 RepID=A0A6A5GAF0_CAERE|nr:hypothetical protein GCK72_018681 [Caenorhabditis remanei]KAF1752127.1 hypothetical protein GCK72_018681 [Caenorhabditis remanei]